MNKTLITIFLILLGGIVGYYGNVIANRKNNELLVQLLKDQLVCTNDEIAQGTSRISDDRLQYLIDRRKDLETKLNYYSKKYGIYL